MNSPYQENESTGEPAAQAFDGTMAEARDDLAPPGDGVSDALAAAKQKVEEIAQPMKEQVRSYAEAQKQDSAQRLDGAVQAVHRAAEEIAQQSPLAGSYLHSGADQLDRVARLLRENSLDDILRMTNRLAHDRPLAFIGGSVAAGFVLARVLRSSSQSSASGQEGRS